MTDDFRPLVVVPARAGSQRIPGKNIKPLGGVPLLLWTLDVIDQLGLREQTVISTNYPELAGLSSSWTIRQRPEELSGDDVRMEPVLVDAMDYAQNYGIEFSEILLLQPTSPFRLRETILRALEQYSGSQNSEGLLSVTPSHEDLWLLGPDGLLNRVFPANPRDQRLREAHYIENGAFYLLSAGALREKGEIRNLKLGHVETSWLEGFDINTPDDFVLAEALLTAFPEHPRPVLEGKGEMHSESSRKAH